MMARKLLSRSSGGLWRDGKDTSAWALATFGSANGRGDWSYGLEVWKRLRMFYERMIESHREKIDTAKSK